MDSIKNVIILANGKRSEKPCDIFFENGVITEISESKEKGESLFATAGYIDIHTHGGLGHDYFECTQEASDAVGKFHLKNGTTSYLATSVATELKDLDVQFEKIRKLENNYADMLGLHLEGPFISLKQKGAQPEKNIKTVYEESDGAFFDKNRDVLKIVTICPNTENSVELVRRMVKNGIKVQAGHDDSVYRQIKDCENAGLDGATHIFCASSQVRRIGLEKCLGLNETAMLEDGIMTEVISDDMHVSEPLFRFILKNKTYKRISLVSDSLSAAGMPVGFYMLGTDTRIYNAGNVCLLENMKTVAGSVTPVSRLVEIVVSYGVKLEEAVCMGNQVPADYIGAKDRGVIEVGKRADIVLLDEKAKLKKVYKLGKEVNL